MSLLSGEAGISVTSEHRAIADVRLSEPNAELILWDVGPRGSSMGSELLAEPAATLALAPDRESARMLVQLGAHGVLLRSVDSERLLAAVQAMTRGLAVFEPTLLSAFSSNRTFPNESLTLTPRESEVLALVAEGLSNKLIADRLKISEHTAKFHVNSLLNKLGAETRTEAVVLAVRRGLLML